MRFYRGLSLSTRLSAVALLALLPLSVVLVMQHLEDRSMRRDAGIRDTQVFAEEIAGSLSAFSSQIASFTDAAAIVIGNSEEISQEANGEYLRGLARRYDQLRAVFITDTEGRLLATSEDAEIGIDLGDRPYVKTLQAGNELAWVQGVSGLETGAVLASFSRVIRNGDGEVVAFLVAAFLPAELDETIQPLLPSDGHLVLIDSAGQVVYSSENPDLALEDFRGETAVAEVLAGQSVEVRDESPFEEGSRYGAIVPVDSMGWAVAYTRSTSTLNASLNATLLQNLALVAAIMAALAVALLVIARQLTRPLKRLVEAAGQVERGEAMAVSMQENPPREIMGLQQAFATMTAGVQEREERLREQADRLATLGEAGAAISANLDYEATVQAIVDAGRSLTEAKFAVFLAREDDGGHLPRGYSGISAEGFEALPPALTSTGLAALQPRRVIRSADVSTEVANGHRAADPAPALRSYMVVPVEAQGSVMGSLLFGHSKPGVFTERHEDLAAGVASWAAIALDNARLYEEARRTQEELRQAGLAKDEFLGLISHELRTPVTTIYGGLRLLTTHRDLLEGEQGEEFLLTMADEGARLVRLIEDLLALTRIELGREMDRLPVYPNGLVREAVDDFARLRPARPLNLDLEDGLPLIEVEPTYFRQVLTNLLSNADKYSPRESTISVVTRREGEQVKLVVADSGPGVEPGEVAKIFDSFYRSDRTADLAPGQGLGLTVCRKLVEAQQGQIWAENRPGGGLAVYVTFGIMASLPEENEEESRIGG